MITKKRALASVVFNVTFCFSRTAHSSLGRGFIAYFY